MNTGCTRQWVASATLNCTLSRSAGRNSWTPEVSNGYDSRQSGWYAQAVYQWMPMWRAGYRFDRLDSGTRNIDTSASGLTAADFPILADYKPKKHSFMVDWSPSEFSRIRLQYARDYSRMGETDNQVFLQYIVSLGAHGAHTF